MRTSIRNIAITAAIGTAAIAAPVVSIGGTAPVDQASARPHPDITDEPYLNCPPGTIPLYSTCAQQPKLVDSHSRFTDAVSIMLGGGIVVSYLIQGVVTG